MFKIDRTQLESAYPAGIPAEFTAALDRIDSVLGSQSDAVVSAQALTNFSIDEERSLALTKEYGIRNPIVTRGLVVRVKPAYKLSMEDAAWFHPEVGKGRVVMSMQNTSAADVASVKEIDTSGKGLGISPYNCSVGHYVTSELNEIGMTTERGVVIVDTSFEAVTLPLWHQWCSQHAEIGVALSQWKNMKLKDSTNNISEKLMADRVKLASKAGGSNVVYSDEINGLYTDGDDIFVTNHAVKVPSNNVVFVRTSALGGYRECRIEKNDSPFVPADVGLASTYFAWDEMTAEHRQRIMSDCSWSGGKSFNTAVMRKTSTQRGLNLRASDSVNGFIANGSYTMRTAKFSSQPIHDYLATNVLVQLTPSSEHGKNIANEVELPLNMEHELMGAIINNYHEIHAQYPNFKLYNPALMSEDSDHIRIPRDVVMYVTKK